MTEVSSHDFDALIRNHLRALFSSNSKLVTMADEKFDQATPILGSVFYLNWQVFFRENYVS